MLLLECLLVDVAVEKAEETNNSVINNVFRIIVILVLFFSLFLFRVPGSYISLSSMHPRSSLEWEFLNHVRSADPFFYFFICLMLQ